MNSKFIVLAFLACLASSYALSKGLGEKIDCLHRAKLAQGRIYEDKIRDALEQLKTAMRNGINGGPPLDPLNVKDYNIKINNDIMNLDSTWTAVSEGLSNFEATELSLSIIGLNLKFKLDFPLASASGDYSLDLTTPSLPEKIFGKGQFNVVSTGFSVKGSGKVATKLVGGKMVVQIKKLEVDLSLKDFSLSVTGAMNDEELSKEISEKATTEFPKMLQANKDKINEAIAKALPYLNDYLAGGAYAVDTIAC